MKYEKFTELTKQLGDSKPELPFILSTISDSLNTGILTYVVDSGKVEDIFGDSKPYYYARQMLVYWPDLRENSFADYVLKTKDELTRNTTIGVKFDLKVEQLYRSAKTLNIKLESEPEVAATLDFLCKGAGDYSNENVWDFNLNRFTFFKDIEASDLKNQVNLEKSAGELTMADIDIEQWQKSMHLSDNMLKKFLELGKEEFPEDIKYTDYDIPEEVFKKYWSNNN